MTDYNNLKVPDLKKILQERSLPVSGNKAELIARLQEHDTSSKNPAPSGSATAIAPPVEDEIDWEEDEATNPVVPSVPAGKPTSDASAAALAAGGQGQVTNPAAVPNQKVDVDPAVTNDLTATKPAANGTSNDAKVAAPAADPTTTGEDAEKTTSTPAPPPVDFAAGVAATSIEDEIKKRQARAKRFNVGENENDSVKALERASRFGTGTGNEQAAGSEQTLGAVKGLDQALPERRLRKRGREDGNDGRGKRRDIGSDRGVRGGRGRRPGRGGGGGGGGERRDRRSTSGSRPQGGGGGGGILNDPVEKAKAEARAKKFATATAA
ncbi:MAG: hypothetical protein M1837_002794 [Sclerophora amabilis]|nr:MAG: hypothetical protein M1837_002794 [Sclerophora amabilis]